MDEKGQREKEPFIFNDSNPLFPWLHEPLQRQWWNRPGSSLKSFGSEFNFDFIVCGVLARINPIIVVSLSVQISSCSAHIHSEFYGDLLEEVKSNFDRLLKLKSAFGDFEEDVEVCLPKGDVEVAEAGYCDVCDL